MQGETWRVVPSAPQFLVSSEGRIMVAPYEAGMPHGGKRQYGGQPHFGVWNKQDGRFIVVYKGKTFKVHQLVCEAFHGARPPEPDSGITVVMHLDENAANNRAENLAWGTQKQNLNAEGFKVYRRTGDHNAVHRAVHDLHANRDKEIQTVERQDGQRGGEQR